MLRPGGRRRRPSGVRRSLRWLPLTLLVALVVGLLVGSLADVSARSASYRHTTDAAYGGLATAVVTESNQTGAALASLMASAPTLGNGTLPFTARATLQQGLDDAVATSQAAWRQAEDIASPPATDDVAAQLVGVMDERASATRQLRSSVDQLLGMGPLPVAGAPTSGVVAPTGPLISASSASAAMAAVGARFEQADVAYRALLASVRRHAEPIRLPDSVWVPAPQAGAALGPVQLGAVAPALVGSAALVPFHHLVVTAVGVEPPAVPAPSGSPALPGVIGVSCNDAQSTPAGAAPTVLPPTPGLTVEVTVSNCGTVTESGIRVTTSVVPSDPPGTAPPPSGQRGGTRATSVTLRSGGSIALHVGPLGVADGHQYLVTVAIDVPPGQSASLPGAVQQMLLLVTA